MILETRALADTIPVPQDMITEVSARYKCQAVRRVHGDRASELTGPNGDGFPSDRGVRATNTAGYAPNSNGHGEGGVGLVTEMPRVVLQCLGPPGKQLWPAEIQHA